MLPGIDQAIWWSLVSAYIYSLSCTFMASLFSTNTMMKLYSLSWLLWVLLCFELDFTLWYTFIECWPRSWLEVLPSDHLLWTMFRDIFKKQHLQVFSSKFCCMKLLSLQHWKPSVSAIQQVLCKSDLLIVLYIMLFGKINRSGNGQWAHKVVDCALSIYSKSIFQLFFLAYKHYQNI